MLRVVIGTDVDRAHGALHKVAEKSSGRAVWLSDASPARDVEAALGGGGLFQEEKTVVLDRLRDNVELWQLVVESLGRLARSSDSYLIYETKVDAASKRLLEKHAGELELYDIPKQAKDRPTVFALARELRAGDKKKLWIAYQRELVGGNAPEALHGVLFWGAKQMLLEARVERERGRARAYVAALAELPHEARREGEELEFALERFVLSV